MNRRRSVSNSDGHIIDLIRHGETTAGKHRLIGRTDVPLSERGWQQLSATVEALPAVSQPLTVWTSPLQRCAKFARSFARQRQAALILEDDFREMDFGDWEMTDMRDAGRDESFQRFFQAPQDCTPPAGESFDAFYQRVARGWQRLTQQTQAGHSMVFTHGGVIRVLCCLLLSLPSSSTSRVLLSHAGHMRVRVRDGQAKLLSLNACPCAV